MVNVSHALTHSATATDYDIGSCPGFSPLCPVGARRPRGFLGELSVQTISFQYPDIVSPLFSDHLCIFIERTSPRDSFLPSIVRHPCDLTGACPFSTYLLNDVSEFSLFSHPRACLYIHKLHFDHTSLHSPALVSHCPCIGRVRHCW